MTGTTVNLQQYLKIAAVLCKPVYAWRIPIDWIPGFSWTFTDSLPRVPFNTDYYICHVDGTLTPVPASKSTPSRLGR